VARAAETLVASFLPPGSATVLHYGHRLVHAVGGTVLFRSVMVAVLPRLTRAHVLEDRVAAERLGNLGLRLMVVTSLPLTALGVVLALPAAEVVFGVGRFSAEDARLLGLVIAVLSLSFPFSAVQRALLSPFYAVRNTRVPLANSVAGAVANVVALPLCVLSFWSSGYALLGLAAAYVVSNIVNVLHAWWRLRRSGLPVPHLPIRVLVRSVVASVGAGAVAGLVWTRVPDGLLGGPLGGAYARLAAAALLGLLVVVLVEGPGHARLRAEESGSPRRHRESGGVLAKGPRLAVAGACSGAAVALTALAVLRDWGPVALVAPIGLFVAAGLVALAMLRFEMFLLALLVTRTSLDAVGSGSSLDPAALLGMLFLGASVVWLLAQWREAGRVELSPLGWAAVVFAGAGLLGVLVSPLFWTALVEWTRLASVCVMVLVVERAAVRPRFRRQAIAAVAVAAIVPLAVSAWQLWSGAGLFDAGGFSRARGTFTHSNPLAAFLALLVVMSCAQVLHLRAPRPRLWAACVLVVTGAGLFATYTRAAWLAAVLGVTVVAAARGRRWLAGVVVIMLVLLVTIPGVASRFADLTEESTARGEPGNSLTWRAEYWSEALSLQASPITGIGLKQVAAQSPEGKQPHNDFLRAYVEMGLIGLAAYLWLLWQVLATCVRAVRATRDGPAENRAMAVGAAGAAAGYVLMSLVANLMTQVVVGLYFATFVAIAAALVARSKTATPDDGPAATDPSRPPRAPDQGKELQCASST
jgi:O-antigen ligase